MYAIGLHIRMKVQEKETPANVNKKWIFLFVKLCL